MADLQPLQQSFESGEISPRLLGRTGSERYQTGLALCSNFLPASHGPAVMRRGLRHVAKLSGTNDDDDRRVFGLEVSLSEQYAVAIGGDFVEVFDAFGAVWQGPSGPERIYNPIFEGGLASWVWDWTGGASVAWEEGVALLTTLEENEKARIAQGFQIANTGVQHNLYLSILADAENDPTATVSVAVGTSFGDASYLNIQTLSQVRNSYIFTPAGSTVWVTLTVTGGAGTLAAQRWVIDEVRCRQNDGAAVLARWASPYAGLDRSVLFAEPEPITNALTFWHPRVAPHAIAVQPDGSWQFNPIGFTGAPPEWVAGNYPGSAAYFQGRLWVGGTPAQPTRFWGSKSDDYFNFTGGTNPDDGLEFTLSQKGRIAWMSGAKNLAIGTENAEYIVTSESGVLQPGDISVESQSRYGSLIGTIVELGRQLVYVSPSETKLRVMSYQWTEDAWVSQDLAWAAEHLPQSRIRELAFAAEPNQLMWMVDRADKLLTCSYNREQGIVGWAQHPMTARVMSIAVTYAFGVGKLWTITRHELPAGAVHYLDRQAGTEYVDTWIVSRGTQQETFTGFDALEGLTVRAVVDGALHPDVTVTGGSITLQYPANEVVAGRQFQGVAETLPLEGGNQAGTQQGVMKRYNRIFLQLRASVLPLINGKRQAERTPSTPMNRREPSRTEVVEVYSGGWDREARVRVTQDLPFPTEVVSLFGELQANKR